jgi:hypothetical protein
VVEEKLHEVFSFRPMDRCAATVWTMPWMISFSNALLDATF